MALDAGTRTEVHDMGSAQLNLFAGAAGLIDGSHDFESLESLFTGDQRLAAGLYGFAEIEELPFEGLGGNRHRIGCAGLAQGR